MILTKKQTIAIDFLEDRRTNEVGYGGGAGGGKSLLGCYWQLKQRMKYPGTRGLIGRAKLKTLKETTLRTFFEVAEMQGLKNGQHFKYNQQSSQINFSNGSDIILKDLFLYPSDPNFDELGSLEITDFYIDESAQVTKKAKDIVQSRVRYALTKNDLIPKGLWTSNPSKNWNYNDFYLPFRNGTLQDNKKFVQSLVTDNPFISPHYIENLKNLSKTDRARLLDGDWEYDDNPNALCDYDNIMAIFENDHLIKTGEKFLTADIARYGSDKAHVFIWDAWTVIEKHSFDKSATTELQSCINSMRIKHGIPKHNCVADEDGVGGGVVDNTGIEGFTNNARPTKEPDNEYHENYRNLQVQCIYYLAKIVNSNNINFECDLSDIEKNQIAQELEYMIGENKDAKKLDVKNKEWVKSQIGRSPDWRDTMFMRAWFDIRPKQKEVFLF